MIYKNFMGGVWMETASEKTFKSFNPAHTGQEVGEFQDSNELDINQAVAFAKDKIRCNLVCPGHVDTNFIRNDSEYSPNDWNTSINNPENYNQRLSQIPLGRLQTPKDIANLSNFHASEDSNMITGGIIAVDGGVTIIIIKMVIITSV